MAAKQRLIAWYQNASLVLGHALYGAVLPARRKRSRTWVVGADDVASMVLQLAAATPGSYSVSFYPHASYSESYDFSLSTPPGSRFAFWHRIAVGPWLLARLMHEARGFIYVGETGFLHDADAREFEFRFLSKHGLGIVCYWCGSDIRSTRRMNELERETGVPNISTYIGIASPATSTDAWDDRKRRLARVADLYADAMFSNSVDHLGYLTRPTEPFLYFLPDSRLGDLSQFADVRKPVIVHATTSPIIKGTPLVRAAIAKLRAEGREFEYVELIGVSNDVVISQLRRAHIVLNQFYGFSPAVFGAEALSAGTVVMMSSDEHVETDLAPGSNDAWVVTKHHEVYDNLKRLLDDPTSWRPIASRGVEWAREYATIGGAAPRLAAVLDRALRHERATREN